MPDLPYSVMAELARVKDRARPPIESWHPERITEASLRIAADGVWYHEGAPITRPRLARLFSTILRREADGEYYLVTPVEKCRVEVEGTPFVAVLLTASGEGRSQRLTFTTNVADEVEASKAHPLTPGTRLADGTPIPEIEIRFGLRAVLSRSVYYQLVDVLVTEREHGAMQTGVWSGGVFHPLFPPMATN